MSLEAAGAVRAYALETYKNRPVIVLEDFGAESLSIHLSRRRLGVGEFLRLAARIAESLEHIHKKRVIHKDLTPPTSPGTRLRASSRSSISASPPASRRRSSASATRTSSRGRSPTCPRSRPGA